MFGTDVLMEDIDINQWRNAQDLLLESAKEKRRIIVLHDEGKICKCEHTDGADVVGKPATIVDAKAQARELYEANEENVDFVAIFERHSFDEYFSRVQNSWVADEPLDSFVHKTYELLDDYPDTMVTYPGPAKNVLGLQWNFGVTRNEGIALAHALIPPESSLLLAVYDEGQIWASLVMTFDGEMTMTELTTVDGERVEISGPLQEVSENAFEWMNSTHAKTGAGLIWTRSAFEKFRESTDKIEAVKRSVAAGEAVVLRKGC